MARKTQKVTSDFLQELDIELGKKKVIKIDTIKGKAEVEVSLYFDEIKVNKIVADLTELITPLLSSDSITADDLANPISLMPVLILREFTDLPLPLDNDLALISAVNDSLIKHGIARQVFEHMNQKEVKKLDKFVSEHFKNMPKFQRVFQELYTKYFLQNTEREMKKENDNIQEFE